MQAGLKAVACKGADHRAGFSGGENRTGGETANGNPRNWFSTALELATGVALPTTTPDSIVTVGFGGAAVTRTIDSKLKQASRLRLDKNILRR